MRRLLFIGFFVLLLQAVLAQPQVYFSRPGGFYDESFSLTLECYSGSAIRYTVNGATPTRNSALYVEPLLLDEALYSKSDIYTLQTAIEELFFTNNITTGITVAEARGVILLACRQHGLPIHEYTPPQVKQAVVGYGKAEKKQVIAMVTALLRLESAPKPDDTADALAIALCHGQSAGSAMRDYFNQP